MLLIAAGAAVAQSFGRFAYGLLLPAIRDDLAISNTLAGLIGAANVGAYLLGTLFVAWATSHYRLLSVLRLGLMLSTTGLLLAAVAPSPLLLAAALFLSGIGGACVWIPSPMIASDALPASQRGLAIGLMGSGIGIGVIFVSILGGSLRSSQGDHAWSSVYLTMAAIGLAILLGVLFMVRHQQARPTGGGGFGGFGALKRMQGWLPLIFSYATFGFIYLLVLGFLTSRLEDDSAWSSLDAATAFTLMGFAMIFGGPAFVALATRISTRLALAIAFALWPIFVFIVLMGAYIPTLMACIGLGFLFSGLPSLITLYVVENATPKDYGPSFAAATLAFGLAQTISPAVGGSLADISGSFTWVFLVSGTMGILGFIAALQLPRVCHPVK
ncbi:MFS transporter [Pseudomonadales bacterium]|nr:MFS transporter [Pseudomonadales bacterium]MDB4090459.1 MFS transporter [Pseudomonadales bacterium]MDB4528950.1 MFS transporter [Pseudomonadales bacterium]MDB4631708.1 MFS transporter [Pseudomonadales bacterium]